MTGDQYRAQASELAAADQVTDPERKIVAFQVEKIGDDRGIRGDALLDPPGDRT